MFFHPRARQQIPENCIHQYSPRSQAKHRLHELVVGRHHQNNHYAYPHHRPDMNTCPHPSRLRHYSHFLLHQEKWFSCSRKRVSHTLPGWHTLPPLCGFCDFCLVLLVSFPWNIGGGARIRWQILKPQEGGSTEGMLTLSGPQGYHFALLFMVSIDVVLICDKYMRNVGWSCFGWWWKRGN